ncbi:hypothetical protein IF1G_09880 [Cordyceps javanica]|uniref:Uncharacterized protein n=1 Tax=Cordyceps javanica TaxID=43265 RepID=A0A545UPI0_9HYPO|nr:hypothetical protein IF1G_09880 [Cordyceps javanica]
MKWRSDRRFREIDWSPPVCERGIYSEPRNLIRQPLKRMDDQILGRSCSEVMELPLCVSCCELGTSLLITTIASIMSTKTTSNLAANFKFEYEVEPNIGLTQPSHKRVFPEKLVCLSVSVPTPLRPRAGGLCRHFTYVVLRPLEILAKTLIWHWTDGM